VEETKTTSHQKAAQVTAKAEALIAKLKADQPRRELELAEIISRQTSWSAPQQPTQPQPTVTRQQLECIQAQLENLAIALVTFMDTLPEILGSETARTEGLLHQQMRKELAVAMSKLRNEFNGRIARAKQSSPRYVPS